MYNYDNFGLHKIDRTCTTLALKEGKRFSNQYLSTSKAILQNNKNKKQDYRIMWPLIFLTIQKLQSPAQRFIKARSKRVREIPGDKVDLKKCN